MSTGGKTLAQDKAMREAFEAQRQFINLIESLPPDIVPAATRITDLKNGKVLDAWYEGYKLKEANKPNEFLAKKKKDTTDLEAFKNFLNKKTQEFRRETEESAKKETVLTQTMITAENYRLKEELGRLEAKIAQQLKIKSEMAKGRMGKVVEEIDRIKSDFQTWKKQSAESLKTSKKLIDFEMLEKMRLEQVNADNRLKHRIEWHKSFSQDEAERKRLVQETEMKVEVEQLRQQFQIFSEIFEGEEGRNRALRLLLLGAGAAATFQVTKSLTPLLSKSLHRALFRPKLISRSSVKRPWDALSFKRKEEAPVVFASPEINDRLTGIVQGLKWTNHHKGFFSHLLLYGQPGTGKTLYAEKIAQEANMDFVMISGPSFDQFSSADAIQEIKNLFSWINSRRKGTLVFVDECDSFLEDRATLSPPRIRVLNEFINQTGTESNKFMMVFETNRPQVLDPAVHSRVGRSVHFARCTREMIERMLRHYVAKHLSTKGMKAGASWWKKMVFHFSPPAEPDLSELLPLIHDLSDRFFQHGFVGRDVTNFVISLSQALFIHPNKRLSASTIQIIAAEQITKKQLETKYIEHQGR